MNHIILNNKTCHDNNKNSIFNNSNNCNSSLKRQRPCYSNDNISLQGTCSILQTDESPKNVEGESTEDSDGDIIGDKLKKKFRPNGPKDLNIHAKIFNSEISQQEIELQETVSVEEEQIDQLEDAVSRELVGLVKERFGKLQKNIKVMTEEAPFYVR
jgi:hypothetical protein